MLRIALQLGTVFSSLTAVLSPEISQSTTRRVPPPPFERNPAAFMQFANQSDIRRAGRQITIDRIGKCHWGASDEQAIYHCSDVDFKEEAALGVRTCINGSVISSAHRSSAARQWEPTFVADYAECGPWQQVVQTYVPDFQVEAAPLDEPVANVDIDDSKSSERANRPSDQGMLPLVFSGTAGFLIGFGCGVWTIFSSTKLSQSVDSQGRKDDT